MQFELPLENPANREAPERESLRPRDAEAENEAVPVTDSSHGTPIETLSPDELRDLYHVRVGVHPRPGFDNREHLITSIENPEVERARLEDEDRRSDREDPAHSWGRPAED